MKSPAVMLCGLMFGLRVIRHRWFESSALLLAPAHQRHPAALTTGKQVYANNCAVCHGSDAGGAKGFPNLRDAIWKFDGSPEGILTTINGGVNVEGGRAAVMPAMG